MLLRISAVILLIWHKIRRLRRGTFSGASVSKEDEAPAGV